ncbi:CocE/NonD family hydrolase C-terminal non-catalytic domain-containing protein, partial [Escherichia coli]|uniref:CocE/NonD family hydrolase C-terminal non-catalytic domain-containing protein n=1 Tax=Escherichia coli TaxID=562 RepID=UPI0039BDF1DD
MLWQVSLRHVDPEGKERVLTRGWLRGSHREVDAKRSKPWLPVHPHTRAEPLTPGKVYEFSIAVLPTAVVLRKGARLALRL